MTSGGLHAGLQAAHHQPAVQIRLSSPVSGTKRGSARPLDEECNASAQSGGHAACAMGVGSTSPPLTAGELSVELPLLCQVLLCHCMP